MEHNGAAAVAAAEHDPVNEDMQIESLYQTATESMLELLAR